MNPCQRETGVIGALPGKGLESCKVEDDDIVDFSKFELPSSEEEFELMFLGQNEVSGPMFDTLPVECIGGPELLVDAAREGGPQT